MTAIRTMPRMLAATLLAACAAAPILVEHDHRRGTLVDGRQEGEWTALHPNGTPEWRGSYRDDRRTGLWTHWYDRGQIRMTGRYDNDRQQGLWQFWHPNGTLQCQGEYRDGREAGEWLFGDERGCFRDGHRVLRWTTPRSDGFYLDDQPVGRWRTLDPGGQWTTLEYPLPDGHRIVREEWPAGGIRREGFLRDDVPIGLWVSRHPNGALRLCGEFADGRPAGIWRAQCADGSLLGSGPVQNGQPIGVWQLATGTADFGQRPRMPWNGTWCDGAIGPGDAIDDVIARWLCEIASKVAPQPLPVTTPIPLTPPAPPPTTEPKPEAPTDPGEFTVREQAALAIWRRYYRDGFLPRQQRALGDYGASTSGRRLGRGDAQKAAALVGRRLPVTRFRTADDQPVDLDQLRGKNVLLIVLRGFTTQVCVYCFAQTAELVPFAGRFAELDTEVVVVYPGARSKLQAFQAACSKEFADGKPPYTMVYDPDLQLTAELGLAGNLARPSALILDRDGIVRSAYVAESEQNIADRPPAQELVDRLAALAK